MLHFSFGVLSENKEHHKTSCICFSNINEKWCSMIDWNRSTLQELMYRAHCTDISHFFHVRYYVVLQVFWIGNLLRFDQRDVTCSVEWQQSYVHEVGVQVFWSDNKCPRIAARRHELQFCSFVCTYYRVGQRYGTVECHFCAQVLIYWSLSFSHNQLIQDL